MLGTKVEYYDCEYDELEAFFLKELGIEYDFVADMDSSNDTSYTFNVSPKLVKNEAEQIEKYLADKKGNYMCHRLLDYLCYKGKIPSGKYLVEVCW